MRLILERKIPRSLDVFYIFNKVTYKMYRRLSPSVYKREFITKVNDPVKTVGIDAGNHEKTECEDSIRLGCAEGYFVQKSSLELNCMSIGIDADI